MKILMKDTKVHVILVLVLTSLLVEGLLGERFIHGEMIRQINETMKSQATQILQGYETYDQNQEILRAGIQADALELNRIHGEFLLKAVEQSYRDQLRGKMDKKQMENRIISIMKHSEYDINLTGNLIWNASAYKDDLETLIKNEVQEPNQFISYLGKKPSELFHTATLDIVIRGGSEQPWETYSRAVYFEPLDLIAIFTGTSSYAEGNVGRLFRRNQENLERNIMMIGSMEDVIILQKTGYSLYSGHFDKNRSRRVTRILYNDMKDPNGFGKSIIGNYGVYKTLMVPMPDQQLQERYGYIIYDTSQDQYVVVSRPTADINERESVMTAISRFVGVVNLIVVCLISWMLISRDEALKQEGLNP